MKVTNIYAETRVKCPFCGVEPDKKKCGHLRFIEDGVTGLDIYGKWDLPGFIDAYSARLAEHDFEKCDDAPGASLITAMDADGVIHEVAHPDVQEVFFHFTELAGPVEAMICYNEVDMYGFGAKLCGRPGEPLNLERWTPV